MQQIGSDLEWQDKELFDSIQLKQNVEVHIIVSPPPVYSCCTDG